MESEFEEEETIYLNATTKPRLMAHCGQLPDGKYKVRIKRLRLNRTPDQNAYYFAAEVKPFQGWLSEQWGEKVKKETAHKALAGRILGMNQAVARGEVVAEEPLSTTKLNIAEFSEYIENCARFLAEFCGIAVIPSDIWWAMQEEPEK